MLVRFQVTSREGEKNGNEVQDSEKGRRFKMLV